MGRAIVPILTLHESFVTAMSLPTVRVLNAHSHTNTHTMLSKNWLHAHSGLLPAKPAPLHRMWSNF